MRIDQTELEEILKQHWDLLLRSLKTLQQSREKTQVYLNKTDLNFEELESIDSLTSKFGRISDTRIQLVSATHRLAKRGKLPHRIHAPNLIYHGEKPFAETVGFIKYADLGLLPFREVPYRSAEENSLQEAVMEG